MMVEKMIRNFVSSSLQSIYQLALFVMVLSILIMIFIMFTDKYQEDKIIIKIKKSLTELKQVLVKSKKRRRLFYFLLSSSFVLIKTLLNRDMWVNPLADVIGVWRLYNSKGDLTTEVVENVVLFIPLIFFLFFFLETTSKKTTKFLKVMGMAIAISFLSSLTIEMLQLFLRLGTWQLSDLAFNTLGGVIGGLIYWVSAKIRGK